MDLLSRVFAVTLEVIAELAEAGLDGPLAFSGRRSASIQCMLRDPLNVTIDVWQSWSVTSDSFGRRPIQCRQLGTPSSEGVEVSTPR
jgi:hypothetical protein